MIRPKIPVMPQPTGITTPPAVVQQPTTTPAPVAPARFRRLPGPPSR